MALSETLLINVESPSHTDTQFNEISQPQFDGTLS